MSRNRRLILPALPSLVLILAGAAPALAADQTVTIQDVAFQPATVTVEEGDTVTWRNDDSAPHTATADGGSWDTGTIDAGASGSVTFDTAGTFAYHCAIHPQMEGTVVVEAAGDGPSAPASEDPGDGAPTQPPTDAEPVDGSGGSPAVLLAALIAAAALLFMRLARSGDRAR